MAKRIFDKCQVCGGEFTTEHHFARYCHTCKPKVMSGEIIPPKIEKPVRQEEPKPYVDLPAIVLDKADVNIHYLDFFFSVICKKCSREIDYSSKKTQSFEAVCPVCGDRFEPEFIVRRIPARK